MTEFRTPVVLLPADHRQIGDHPFHVAGHKYVNAVVQAAQALPLIVPALGSASDIDALLGIADGILLPGAVSNVHPSHFGQEVRNPALPLDPERDGLTLGLIRAAVSAGIPLLGICRGFQEINVAFGGSLHQAVHETGAHADHREDGDLPLDGQYAQVHPVRTVAGGMLERITGAREFMVNSLHGQGIDRLAGGLVAEAHAPDGLVEAVSVADAPAFALAVQWHPEWKVLDTPPYLALFRAFGDACRARVARGRAAS
ncbi:MAG: gamma-glutamyl-gamma-aminobutyrate hydrolase family protein [Pseudomonadota bacterium]